MIIFTLWSNAVTAIIEIYYRLKLCYMLTDIIICMFSLIEVQTIIIMSWNFLKTCQYSLNVFNNIILYNAHRPTAILYGPYNLEWHKYTHKRAVAYYIILKVPYKYTFIWFRIQSDRHCIHLPRLYYILLLLLLLLCMYLWFGVENFKIFVVLFSTRCRYQLYYIRDRLHYIICVLCIIFYFNIQIQVYEPAAVCVCRYIISL